MPLIIARRELPVRMAAGLAIICPVALIALSAKSSLLVPRYFIPVVPGLLLLVAASAADESGRYGRLAAIALVAKF